MLFKIAPFSEVQDNSVSNVPLSIRILTRIGEVWGWVKTGRLGAVLGLQRFARQIQLFPIPQRNGLQPEYEGAEWPIEQNLLLCSSDFSN